MIGWASKTRRRLALRVNSTHSLADRGDDFYPSPIEAVKSLIAIEHERLPSVIWEPACGDGAIVKPLEDAGHYVIATDLVDYGGGYEGDVDYLSAGPHPLVEGIVTNPPYKLATEFVQKAVAEVPYSAWLLRLNFLESIKRLTFFRQTPPARVWVSSRRLPMMHRHGWDGPKSTSNMTYAWFVFEKDARETKIGWFDWAEHS
jgi:hypothetical protein